LSNIRNKNRWTIVPCDRQLLPILVFPYFGLTPFVIIYFTIKLTARVLILTTAPVYFGDAMQPTCQGKR